MDFLKRMVQGILAKLEYGSYRKFMFRRAWESNSEPNYAILEKIKFNIMAKGFLTPQEYSIFKVGESFLNLEKTINMRLEACENELVDNAFMLNVEDFMNSLKLISTEMNIFIDKLYLSDPIKALDYEGAKRLESIFSNVTKQFSDLRDSIFKESQELLKKDCSEDVSPILQFFAKVRKDLRLDEITFFNDYRFSDSDVHGPKLQLTGSQEHLIFNFVQKEKMTPEDALIQLNYFILPLSSDGSHPFSKAELLWINAITKNENQ